MTYSPNLVRLWITRGIVYVLLGVCAFLMLFPFIYMLFTSVKLSNDVYTRAAASVPALSHHPRVQRRENAGLPHNHQWRKA